MKTLIVAALFFSLSAQAEVIKMLSLQTDADTTQTGTVSIEVAADTTFLNVSYGIDQDPTSTKNISVADLNKSYVTIVKKGPVAALELAAKSASKNDMMVSVRYLYKFSIFGSDRRVKKLHMYYVAPTNLYETRDPDTNKVVTNAFAYVRYDSSGDAAGIDRIETW